jgi:hypothetical protein
VKSSSFSIARLALRGSRVLLFVLQIESVYYCGDKKLLDLVCVEDQGPLEGQSRGLLDRLTCGVQLFAAAHNSTGVISDDRNPQTR